MAIGKVTVTQENSNSGSIADVERKVLFIGTGGASANTDVLHVISQDSDLDALLGNETSDLKTNLQAALDNGGSNFTGWAIAISNMTWSRALEFALDTPNDIDVEFVVITDPVTNSTVIDEMQAAAIAANNTWAKLISIHCASPRIVSESQTWGDYIASQTALVKGKACNRVSIVPQIHGNNLGVVVGRLVNDNVSIADSPMRVRTGAVTNLGEAPTDSADTALTMAHLSALADQRLSVPQWYTGKDGIYWADHMTLDSEAGDFQVIEHVRVIDYVTRRVRILAINKIADRALNSSDSSTAFHQNYFMQPILDAAKTTLINGEAKPGMVQSPVDGDVTIKWKTSTEVELWILAAPVNNPKKISAHIALDLNRLN